LMMMYGIKKKTSWSNFNQSNQRWPQRVCLDKPSRRIGHTLVFGWMNHEIIRTRIRRLSRSESREFLIQYRVAKSFIQLGCQGKHVTAFRRFLYFIAINNIIPHVWLLSQDLQNFIAINQIYVLTFFITDNGVVLWIAKETEANDEL